jgi:hypothetical protein
MRRHLRRGRIAAEIRRSRTVLQAEAFAARGWRTTLKRCGCHRLGVILAASNVAAMRAAPAAAATTTAT